MHVVGRLMIALSFLSKYLYKYIMAHWVVKGWGLTSTIAAPLTFNIHKTNFLQDIIDQIIDKTVTKQIKLHVCK